MLCVRWCVRDDAAAVWHMVQMQEPTRYTYTRYLLLYIISLLFPGFRAVYLPLGQNILQLVRRYGGGAACRGGGMRDAACLLIFRFFLIADWYFAMYSSSINSVVRTASTYEVLVLLGVFTYDEMQRVRAFVRVQRKGTAAPMHCLMTAARVTHAHNLITLSFYVLLTAVGDVVGYGQAVGAICS